MIGGFPNTTTNTNITGGLGQQGTNPWLANSNGTPMIAGLVGGADVAGLLEKSLTQLPESIRTSILEGQTSNTLAAIVRVDATREILSQLVDGIAVNSDDYIGYDLLLFVNISNIPLDQPKLGINLGSGVSTLLQNLATGGVTRHVGFGGNGSFKTLSALNPGSVWATLIPDGTVKVNANLGGSIETFSDKTIADTSSKVEYLKAVQAALDIPNKLQGLSEIVLSPDGKHIYAVDSADNAVVVINASNLSERQLIKQGDIVKNGTGTTIVDEILRPRDIVISPDGRSVYVAGFNSTTSFMTISHFRRDLLETI